MVSSFDFLTVIPSLTGISTVVWDIDFDEGSAGIVTETKFLFFVYFITLYPRALRPAISAAPLNPTRVFV